MIEHPIAALAGLITGLAIVQVQMWLRIMALEERESQRRLSDSSKHKTGGKGK